MKITVGQGTHVAGRFSCIIMMIFMTTTIMIILRLIMKTVLMLMNRSVDIPIVSNIHGFSPKTSSLPETYQESKKGLSNCEEIDICGCYTFISYMMGLRKQFERVSS